MGSEVHLRKYGAATTFDFDLHEIDGVDLRIDAVHASGDTKVMKDEGAEANTGSGFVDEGQGYSIALTDAEMTAARIKIIVVDQTATKAWLDRTITIETYGHASAQHAFDLDTASPIVASVTGAVGSVTGHTAQTGDNYPRLGAPAGASMSADVAAVKTDTGNLVTRITATLFSGITSLAEWLGLIAGKQAGDATALTEIKATGAGSGTYDPTSDAIEALRDRGDAAWITGGGGAITQSINVRPAIPQSVDLANTATVRIGLMLTNALDDLPSTAEITPGTISIDRKAIGGTSWSSILSDAACSEAAGLVYYDEVFDAGTGYAEGDTIRVTFKSQSVVADANTFEITGSGGVMFYTEVRQTMVGTDSASTHSAADVLSAIQAAGTHLTLIKAVTDLLPDAGALSDLATVLTAIQHATYGLSALRTQGDAAWATATGFSTHDAAAVKTAIEAGGSSLATLLARITALIATKAEMDTAHGLLATPANVNTQVSDVLKTDTVTLPGQGAPTVTPTFEMMVAYLYKAWRNKSDQSETTQQLYADDGSTVDQKLTVSESGGTVTKGKVATGP